jgi:hypothetical protein
MTQVTADWQDLEGVWHLCHCRLRAIKRTLSDMEIFFGIFFVLLAIAAAAGWTADSRDYADWKPSNDGFRSA